MSHFFPILRPSQIKPIVSKIYDKLKWKFFLVKNHLPLRFERGSWSMDIQDFEFIFRSIKSMRNNKELTLLELGTGVSTLIFVSRLSKFSLDGLIISFEAEKECVKTVQNLIDRYSLSKRIQRIYHVGYKNYENYAWFNQEMMETILESELSQKKGDVLVIDSPPDILCPYSRKPAIPFLLRYLKNECIVFLHDAKRNDESRIVKEWAQYFNKTEIINTPLGLAVFWDKK